MKNLFERIRSAITFDNVYDDSPDFVETRWFRWTTNGVFRPATPFVFGIRVLVNNLTQTERIHTFWATSESFQFDDTPVRLVDGRAQYAEPPFLPKPSDMFAFSFGGGETLFEVTSLTSEAGCKGILRIEAEPSRCIP